GWVGATDSNPNRVSFCCFRPDRRDMVAGLAQRIGFNEMPGRPGVWLATDHELAEWFRQNLYTGPILRSPYKRVPDVIKSVCQRQVETFLTFYGDQHIDRGSRQFYTSSQRMADDIQELLLRVGKRSGIYSRAQ